MVSLSGLTRVTDHAISGGSVSAPTGSGTPFSGVLKDVIAQTTKLDQQAQSAVTGMLNGSGVEVHDAMIATQKADMAFELALQVRNKAVGAYQSMMAMQF